MDNSEILQDLSVEFSSMIKKNLKNIKKLDASTQRELGKFIEVFKNGLNDLS